MTNDEKQSWEQVRAKGRDRFLIREGLLRRGILFGIVFALLQMVFIFRSRSEPLLTVVASWAFATVAFGALMGLHEWQARERDYQKPTDDEAD